MASAKNPRKWGALLGFQASFVDEPAEGRPAPPARITLPDGSETRTDAADVDAVLSKALGRNVHLADTPPDAGSFEEVWPDIEGLAPEVIDLCSRCLHREPRDRPTALVAALLLAEAVDARVYVPLMDLGPPRRTRISPWDERAAGAPTSAALVGPDAEATDKVGRHRA